MSNEPPEMDAAEIVDAMLDDPALLREVMTAFARKRDPHVRQLANLLRREALIRGMREQVVAELDRLFGPEVAPS